MQNKAQEIIDKILNSNAFNGSVQYGELLKYLLTCYNQNQIPTESAIAIDVFKKDPKDSSVRVYMHNLRNKIDSYYASEGASDKERVRIPKGKYVLELYKVETPGNAVGLLPFKIIIGFLLLAVVLLVLGIYSIRPDKGNDSEIWRDILQDDRPVTVVVGDYFLYHDSLYSGGHGLVRHFSINNEADLDAFLASNNASSSLLHKTNHTFLTKLAPAGLGKVLPLIVKSDVAFNVALATNVVWDDLKNQNVIYIGSYKTLHRLQGEFDRLRFKFNPDTDELCYRKEGDNICYSTSKTIDEGLLKDYPLLVKMKGVNETNWLMVISIHDIGGLALVDRFTDPVWLHEFENNNDIKAHESFKALFEVEGYEKTDFTARQLMLLKE